MPVTGKQKRAGGRPTAPAAAKLGEIILDIAATLFLRDGYAATSIETIAKQAGVAKRTFYARFADKSALFKAVVERLIADWLSGTEKSFAHSGPLEEALLLVGATIIDVALSPPALGLRRLIIAESARFPELAEAVRQAGAGTGTARIAALLCPDTPESAEAMFGARQFMALVLTEPLNRATTGGVPLNPDQRRVWVMQSVHLFLRGWLRTGGTDGGEVVPDRDGSAAFKVPQGGHRYAGLAGATTPR